VSALQQELAQARRQLGALQPAQPSAGTGGGAASAKLAEELKATKRRAEVRARGRAGLASPLRVCASHEALPSHSFVCLPRAHACVVCVCGGVHVLCVCVRTSAADV